MTPLADMDYLYCDVPEDVQLREYGRMLARRRREEREAEGGRHVVASLRWPGRAAGYRRSSGPAT